MSKATESDHADLAGKWATINGTFCYVRSVTVDECGDETVEVSKSGRNYTLIGDAIYSVSV